MSDLKITPVVAQDDSDLPSGLADGQLLVLVLDANPNQALFARNPQHLVHWLDAALALVNSHLMLRTNNSAAVVAAHGLGCSFLHPSPNSEGNHDDVADAQFEGFRTVETAVRREIRKILWRETEGASRCASNHF